MLPMFSQNSALQEASETVLHGSTTIYTYLAFETAAMAICPIMVPFIT